MKTKLFLFAILAFLPLIALPQYEGFDTGDSKPWASFKLPKKTMKLDFKNANIDMVISLFSKTSGITILKDPSLKDPISLTTADAVSLDDAFSIFNSALGLRNYQIQKDGKVLVIKQKPQRNSGRMSMDPTQLTGDSGSRQDQGVLKVYRIVNAAASQVARVINDVFTPSASGGFTMGGFPGGRNMRNGRFPGLTLGSNQPNIRASSDDYSNTVIVNAPSQYQRQVEDLIAEIDKPAEEAQHPKVYHLNFATSDEMQPVISGVLSANAPKGRGESATTTIDQRFAGGGGFRFGGLFGGNRNSASNNSSVVSEPRTNSLIITTTDENHQLIAQVIKDLDTDVKISSTTFVVPLSNTNANDLATIMRQAFGTRSGTNAGFNSTTQTRTTQNSSQNRTNNRNNTRNNGNSLGGGLGGNIQDSALPVALADPTAQYGDLRTNISIGDELQAQFFGGQFGGQNQNRTSTQNQTQGVARDANGRVVPVQDLTNQVTVIPDPNTNSLIIVTTPGNADLIKQIIEQLDRTPEQVMIETIIVEATLGSEDKLGVEWKFAQAKAFGNTGTSGTVEGNFGLQAANGQGFRYTLTGGDLNAFVNALRTDTKFQVLSTPRIFTSNNQNAEINISQSIPYVTSQRTDVNGNLTYTYSFEDVGIVLNVTPHITSNGYVTMDVLQTANDLQGFTSFNAPIVNQRQADTNVSVKDGETIILGGIIRSQVTSTTNKIPLLGDIPILGQIFRSTDKTKSKTELLVFLTPHVVRNPEEAAKLREQEKARLSKPTQDDLNKLFNGGTSEKKDNSGTGGGH